MNAWLLHNSRLYRIVVSLNIGPVTIVLPITMTFSFTYNSYFLYFLKRRKNGDQMINTISLPYQNMWSKQITAFECSPKYKPVLLGIITKDLLHTMFYMR